MRQIYLDYNATTPIAPSVRDALLPFLSEHFGNPSSSHALGRACHEAIEDARAETAAALDADSDEIFFTSGGTESNNLALKGVLFRESIDNGAHLIISGIEHPAILQPAEFLRRQGYELTVVGCDSRGTVSPEAIQDALRPTTRLVSIMHANNEIGSVQPIREIADLCHAQDVLVHTDAAQSVGKLPVTVSELDVDLLSIAGHKLYAPKGVGALYVRRGIPLEPALHGAGHEGGIRPGTENVPYIVGLGRAMTLATEDLNSRQERLAQLRDRLEEQLRDTLGDRMSINGLGAERLPNTSSVNFPNVTGLDLLKRIPELCASTGSACHSGVTTLSATLKGIGLDPETAQGTVRLSLGWNSTADEIDRAASLLLGAWEMLQ